MPAAIPTKPDLLGYEGKTCVVTGAASGMGGATARILGELGAEVIGLDIQKIDGPIARSIQVNLMEEASIDAAVAEIPDSVDRLFNCAGLPGAPRFEALDTTLVNFVGLRHLTESLLPRIPSGGAVASITSVAGMGYTKNLEKLHELLATASFGEGKAWLEANSDVNNGYLFSKQAIIAYTYARAGELARREIRINCLSPAPTDTPMMPAFHDQISAEFMDEHFQAPVGRNATPEEMAEPLILLNSDASRFVSGHNLFVDYGYAAQTYMGQRPALL
ncbi:MAG: coniferyl-alcohol dehydrogenase [Deltaproteobacteria bacterium]|nr:coniferyl-alcohol dehydrogenase [Deltaproteobacteria bacterium]MBW2418473.1 coniferyl-alcohol dehydrogenase [Deltaproteobacteria bacterium]